MAGRWDAQLDVTHAVEGTYGNLVYNDKGHATLYFTGSSEGKCMVQAKRSIYLVGTLLEQTDTVDETRIFSYTVDDHTVTMCAEDDTLIGEVDGRGKKMECRWKGNYMHFKRK
ncbi:MAG: hypothetical protein SPJ13_08690 [Bacteroidales bacterium]|nr:hypothetical protein [Bacteroidales bacterium]